jgi:hypothetical protein
MTKKLLLISAGVLLSGCCDTYHDVEIVSIYNGYVTESYDNVKEVKVDTEQKYVYITFKNGETKAVSYIQSSVRLN